MNDEQTTPDARRRPDLWGPVWLLVAALVWSAHGLGNVVSRDAALYVYAGQEVASGLPPYVGVMNRSGPVAHLLPALGVVIGRATDVDDLTAIRALFLFLVIPMTAMVYVMAQRLTASRLAGCVAAATLLGFAGLARLSTLGPQSKSAMVVLMVVALLMLQRQRMVGAGIATALSVLAWQPVLFALAPVALVVGWWGNTGLRARLASYLRYGLSGLATLGAMAGALALAGGYDAFVEGFWVANAAATDQPGILARPDRVWETLSLWLGWTKWLLFAGLLLSLVGWLLPGRRPGDPVPAAFAAGTLGGTVWTFTAFNGAPDSLMLLPLAALGIGSAAGALLVLARRPAVRRAVTGVLAASTVAMVALTAHMNVTMGTTELTEQQAAADRLFAALPEDATVFSAEAPHAIALTGHRSISRYVLFGAGMTTYIDQTWPGGLVGYRAWLREQEPTVVLAPESGVRAFLRPLMRRYDEIGISPGYSVWLRQDVDDATRERVTEAVTG